MGLTRVFSRAVAGCAFEPSGVGQVLGTSMSGERVSAHKQELNPLVAQGGQHVFEVWVEHRRLP